MKHIDIVDFQGTSPFIDLIGKNAMINATETDTTKETDIIKDLYAELTSSEGVKLPSETRVKYEKRFFCDEGSWVFSNGAFDDSTEIRLSDKDLVKLLDLREFLTSYHDYKKKDSLELDAYYAAEEFLSKEEGK